MVWLVIVVLAYLAYQTAQSTPPADPSADPGGGLLAGLSDFGGSVSDVVTGIGGEVTDIVGGVVQGDPLQLAASLVKGFEGFSASAYPDPPGQSQTWSIGYGHQIRPGDPYTHNSVIPETEAATLLQQDLAGAAAAVTSSVAVSLDPYQVSALISLAYNIGAGAFRSSTLVQKLNAGDLSGAGAEFSRWVYAGGQVNSTLQARRSVEQGVFLNA